MNRLLPEVVAEAVVVAAVQVAAVRAAAMWLLGLPTHLRHHRKPHRMRSNSIHREILQTLSCCSSRYGGSPAILGSFGESSVASRRKRGPVAFRPRLWAGLALSVLLVTEL